MGERMIKTDPFQSGQQTNAKGKSEPAKLKFSVSKMRNMGEPDPLAQALTKPPPLLPNDNHRFRHSKTSKPTGAHYTPMGEFGKPKGSMMSKATNPMGKGTFRGKP